MCLPWRSALLRNILNLYSVVTNHLHERIRNRVLPVYAGLAIAAAELQATFSPVSILQRQRVAANQRKLSSGALATGKSHEDAQISTSIDTYLYKQPHRPPDQQPNTATCPFDHTSSYKNREDMRNLDSVPVRTRARTGRESYANRLRSGALGST